MELYQYLWENDISTKAFAASIQRGPGWVSLIVNYKHVPTRKMAYIIQKATKGAVKAEELIAMALRKRADRIQKEARIATDS